MKRSKTSKSWMNEHVSDPYVHKAKIAGYRSRAAFKLLEANEKFNFLTKKMNVVDLGSAPGSWSQVISQMTGCNGNIFALDLLEMAPIKNVEFLIGDFREQEMLDSLEKKLGKTSLDLVISDMAPNISGIKTSDQAGIIHLNELALQFSTDWLKPNGCFLVKSFVGAEFDGFVAETRKHFEKVTTFKPASSRDRSSEIFVFGRNKI